MKRGGPPTAVNARTGEFTPPGLRAPASVKSFAETSVLDMPPVFQQGRMRQLQGVVAGRSAADSTRRRCRVTPAGRPPQPSLSRLCFGLRGFDGVIAADWNACVDVRLRGACTGSFNRVVPAVRPHEVRQ